MRERGRGVSLFFSLSLSLSRKKSSSVPKSVVVFFFLFPSPTKEKFINFSGPRLFSKRKEGQKKTKTEKKRDKHQQQNKRQTRPKRREKKAETKKPNRNKIEIKNAKRVVFLNFLILAHVFKTQHTYLQTMFAATQQIASVAGLKATKVQVRVSIVSDLCRSSSLLLLLLDSWNG